MKFTKYILALLPFLFLSAHNLKAQLQEDTFNQSSLVYKKNGVKSRISYGKRGNIIETAFFDRDGRVTKVIHEATIVGKQVTNYFQYDAEGRLIHRVDTVRKEQADKKTIKAFRELFPDDLEEQIKAIPKLEVLNYELTYENGELTKLTQFDGNGHVKRVESYLSDGLICTVENYYQGHIQEKFTWFYETDDLGNKYLYQKLGWYLTQMGSKMSINYMYINSIVDGHIIKRQEQDGNYISPLAKYFEYNEKGLLSAAEEEIERKISYRYYED